MNPLRVAALIPAWLVQYLFVVPIILTWRVLRFGLKLGVVGVALVFLPIIGWIVLAFMYRSRKRHRELVEAIRPPEDETSVWSPWGLDWARSEA